jgi:hypothetical protein
VASCGRSLGSTLCADTCNVGLSRVLAEASTRHGTPSRVTTPRANIVRNELRSNPGRSAGTNASSKPRFGPKPQSRRRSHPVGYQRPKPKASARVPSSFEERDNSPKRSGTRTVRSKDASHRRATEVVRGRKTRSGNSTTSPLELGSFRRMNPGDRCVGLPHRHHPLSEFLTPSAV